jgi:hypothetical protein
MTVFAKNCLPLSNSLQELAEKSMGQFRNEPSSMQRKEDQGYSGFRSQKALFKPEKIDYSDFKIASIGDSTTHAATKTTFGQTQFAIPQVKPDQKMNSTVRFKKE